MSDTEAATPEMRLELMPVPVSDVDRAKAFYEQAGFKLNVDTRPAEAMRVGKHQAHVSRYESGQRRLDVLEVREICQALGTTLEEFARRLEKALK
jgi:transcriptional regulator with XRE-family HTH domain